MLDAVTIVKALGLHSATCQYSIYVQNTSNAEHDSVQAYSMILCAAFKNTQCVTPVTTVDVTIRFFFIENNSETPHYYCETSASAKPCSRISFFAFLIKKRDMSKNVENVIKVSE